MASRGVVIPFPIHRARRPARQFRIRALAARASLDALRELQAEEQVQLRFFAACVTVGLVVMGALSTVL